MPRTKKSKKKDAVEKLINASPAALKALGSDQLPVWIMANKVMVDHREFNFDRHRYLIDIYGSTSPTIVVQKAAQMGLTIWAMLKVLHFAINKAGVKIGYYLPTVDGIQRMSKDRLSPLIEENPQLLPIINKKEFNDTMGLKQIGKSSLYLSHISGSTMKDSTPLDALVFDEVRLMDMNDIDQTLERISHSPYKYRYFISTCGYPGVDINAWFLRGNQKYWHSRCFCGDDPKDWVVLPLVWPDCIVDDGKEVYYICPKCHAKIENPQNGQFVEHNPGGEFDSFHISQLISDYITPKEIWMHWNNCTNIKEFYNAKLGRPYIDEDARPISDEVIKACVNVAIPWSVTRKSYGPIGMGMDQRSGQNHVVIAQKMADRKKRIIHVEVIDSYSPQYKIDDGSGIPKIVSPFKRAEELMEIFDVDVCVCDGLPNANDAHEFGRKFDGRVYLAYYQDQIDQMRWSDRTVKGRKKREPVALRNVPEHAKFKYHVMLDRYLSIEAALKEWQNKRVEIPDLKKLVQIARNKDGRFVPTPILLEFFMDHLKGVVREKFSVKDDGTYRMKWVNLGLDPHFLHAWNYCNAALERIQDNFGFVFLGEVRT